MFSLCLSVCLSGFLLQSKDMKVRLSGDCKLPVGVNVSISGCLSLCVKISIILSRDFTKVITKI